MKRVLSITIILIIGLTALVGCGEDKIQKDSFSEIEERGYIVMGLDDTFAPMGFRNESGEIVGFDVDLAKIVFQKMDLELKLQPIDWSMKETELNSGNIDIIWNGYSITEERKEKVDFSTPYLENRQVIITLSDLEINSKEELEGKKVSAQMGSSAVAAIETFPEVSSSFDGGEPVVFDTNNEAFMDLEAGRVDAVVADEILARYYIEKRGKDKFNVSNDDFGKEFYGIGLRKEDDELLQILNDALVEVTESEQGIGVSNKWFGENILE